MFVKIKCIWVHTETSNLNLGPKDLNFIDFTYVPSFVHEKNPGSQWSNTSMHFFYTVLPTIQCYYWWCEYWVQLKVLLCCFWGFFAVLFVYKIHPAKNIWSNHCFEVTWNSFFLYDYAFSSVRRFICFQFLGITLNFLILNYITFEICIT